MIKCYTSPKLSVEEARIHAHLCADGYLYVSKEREEGRWRKRYHIRYSNTQEILRKEFANDVLNAYNRKAVQCQKNEIEIKAKWIFQRLSNLGAGNSHKWFIGSEILKSPKVVKVAWLKAFFDDEARVELPNPPKDYHRRITIKSVNKGGLLQVQSLLKELSVKSVITGENSDKTYYLRISEEEDIYRYAQSIGFNHPKKNVDLNNLKSQPRRHFKPKGRCYRGFECQQLKKLNRSQGTWSSNTFTTAAETSNSEKYRGTSLRSSNGPR
jgi:hypothetical protein